MTSATIVRDGDDRPPPRRWAAFLDRDGTIIVERHYLHDPLQVALETDAAAGMRMLQDAGWVLVMVTNQSGIARGYFTLEAATRVNDAVEAQLRAEGVQLEGIFMCPHGPEDACLCRKPAAGMLHEAASRLNLDLARSVVIGDKRSDLEAADRVGAAGILVTTGYGAHDRDWASASGHQVAASLLEAACHLQALAPPSPRSTAENTPVARHRAPSD